MDAAGAVQSVAFSSPRGLRIGMFCALGLMSFCGCQYTAKGKNAAGVQLYQSGQYQQAAQYFQQAVNQSPNDSDSYYNLASAYHQIGRLNRRTQELDYAEQLYNRSLDFNPNNRDCYRALSVLLVDKNQPDKAQKLLSHWQALSPTNPAPKVEMARLRQEFGDKQGAKDYLQQALAQDPYDIRALAALGSLQEQEGNTAQALANYERSLYRDQFQPQLAAKVQQLRIAMNQQNQIQPLSQGGTQMVTTPLTNPSR